MYLGSSTTLHQFEEFEHLKERVASAENDIKVLKDLLNSKVLYKVHFLSIAINMYHLCNIFDHVQH